MNTKRSDFRRLLPLLLAAAVLASAWPALADFRATRMGARPRAMGSAFVSLADDGNATLWNPAALGRDERMQTMVTRAWLYNIDNSSPNLRNDALSIDLPGADLPLLGRVHFGFGFVRLGITDVYYEDAYSLAAGCDLPWLDGLAVGVTGKIYRLSAPGYEAYDDPSFLGDDSAFTGDLGLHYDSGADWTLGAAVYNLEESYLQLLSTTVDPDPVFRTFAVGGSYLFRDTLLLTCDLRSREGGLDDTILNGGAEIWFFDALALRSGLFEGRVTMGVGLQDRRWQADFALETHRELGDVYMLSFTLRN